MATDRQSLLLRGVLDLCVLALLDAQRVHGYEIAARLGEHGLEVAGGSVYPLLARLERAGLVCAEQQPSASGPPRRWWRLTTAGSAALAEGRGIWVRTSTAVDALLGPRPSTGKGDRG